MGAEFTIRNEVLVTDKGSYPHAGRLIRTALYEAYFYDPRHDGTSTSEARKEYDEASQKITDLIMQSQTNPANDVRWNKVLDKALNPWTQSESKKHFAELVACIRNLE